MTADESTNTPPEPTREPSPSPPPAERVAAGPDSGSSALEPAAAATTASNTLKDKAERQIDRWAHRRLEPRGLAVLWSTYLFVLTLALFARAPVGLTSATDHTRAVVRPLLAGVMVGVVVLWPLVRLSQASTVRGMAGGGGRDAGMIGDFFVIVVPVQAVIWPQATKLLAAWPVPVVGAVSGWVAAWAALVGGLLALAMRPMPVLDAVERKPEQRPRTLWMCGFVGLVLLGLAIVLLQSGAGNDDYRVFRPWWMTSPITGIYELTRDRSWTGLSAMVTPGHWWAIVMVGLLAIPVWVLALTRAGRLRPWAKD